MIHDIALLCIGYSIGVLTLWAYAVCFMAKSNDMPGPENRDFDEPGDER